MIQGGFSPDKVVHIPTMVKAPEATETLPEAPEILFVGRLSHEKGLPTLLEAFGLLSNNSARLTIIGDDTSSYAEGLKASVPDRLKSRIIFKGFMEQEEIRRSFERAYCFVAPSNWYENQPNTVLEGMSHARPAVVSDLGSMRELVADGVTGYRFEAGDALALAARLDDLLANRRKAQAMGLRARRFVLRNHSVERHLSSMDAIFQRCVDQRRMAPKK